MISDSHTPRRPWMTPVVIGGFPGFLRRLVLTLSAYVTKKYRSFAGAELLNVSPPYVTKLLDEGKIPSHRDGTQRRVLFKDVMTYRDEHFRARSAILDQMAAIDQELGLI